MLWRDNFAEHFGSCRLERKRRFLLATPFAKSGSRRLECKRRFLLATPTQSYKSHSKIAVATVWQPILEDHNSRRLERKPRFSLATLVMKVRHSPSFDCSGEIILPSIF